MRAGIGIAVLLSALGAAAQEAGTELIVELRQGTDLSLATEPGLDFIVFELLGQLWRMPVNGGAALPLTSLDTTVRHPRLSSDGARIVYQQLGEHGWDIWMLELAAGRHTQLTSAPGNEREPDFLPDQSGVVFSADRGGGYDLWSVAEPGGQWQPISTEPGDARYPDVAANGAITYVVEDTNSNALRIRSDGLTSTIYETQNQLSAPGWRPGGGVIIFTERSAQAGAKLQMALLAPELLLRELTADEDLFASGVGWLDSASFVYAADGQIWRRRLAGPSRRPVHLFATALIARPEIPQVSLSDGDESATRETAADERDAAAVYSLAGDIWLYSDGEAQQLTDDPYWNEAPLYDERSGLVFFARNHNGERRLFRILPGTTANPEPLTPPGVRAFAAVLDQSGTRLAWLESESGFSQYAPARLNTLNLDDGTQRSGAMLLRAHSAPQWLADNRDAMLSVDVQHGDGTIRRTSFDARLQEVTAEPVEPQDSPTQPTDQPTVQIPAASDAQQEPAPARTWVIQAGRLFDGVGTTYRRHVDIHIEADRITAVVARDRLPLPERVIDATELTVLPGFIDLHTHDLSLLGELAGRAWLAWGVTTVRSLGPHTAAARGMSAAWHAGLLPGPRYIAAQPPSAAGGASDLLLRLPPLIDDPFVTLPGEPPAAGLPTSLLPVILPYERPALVRRYSPGHAHYQDVFALLSASGATEMSSLGVSAPDGIGRLLRNNAAANAVWQQLFPAGDRARWRAAGPLVDGLAARQQSLSRLLRAGGRIAIGTESPQLPPGLAVHLELQLLAEAGIPPDQILRAATGGAALAIGLENEIGSVEAGRLADIVIVAGDPLSHISDTLAIHSVVRGGQWFAHNTILAPPGPD